MAKRKLWLGAALAVPLACAQVTREGADSSKGGSENAGGVSTLGGRPSGGGADGGEPMGAGGSPIRSGGGRAGGPASGGKTSTVAGSSGSAGCGSEEPTVVNFPECTRPPLALEGSTCGVEATRRALGCGQPGSSYDQGCCPRATCRDDADCEPEMACIPKLAQAHYFTGSMIETCEADCDGECSCFGTDDVDTQGYCVSQTEDWTSFDCDTRGRSCAELERWRTNLADFPDLSHDDVTATGATAYASRTIACAEKLDRELADSCGVTPQCECSGAVCSQPLDDFHPFGAVLGKPIAFEKIKAAALLCPSLDFAIYSECADGVASLVLSPNDGESAYSLRFQGQRFVYGRAAVAGAAALCPQATREFITIVSGKSVPEVTCRSCELCPGSSDQGAGGSGGGSGGEGGGEGGIPVPACAYNRNGEIVIPTR